MGDSGTMSVAGLSEPFEPPEITAHTPAPRTLQLQAKRGEPGAPAGWSGLRIQPLCPGSGVGIRGYTARLAVPSADPPPPHQRFREHRAYRAWRRPLPGQGPLRRVSSQAWAPAWPPRQIADSDCAISRPLGEGDGPQIVQFGVCARGGRQESRSVATSAADRAPSPAYQTRQFRARRDPELGEHLAQVIVDGARAQVQLRGDLAVAQAIRHQVDDLPFLRGELAERARF